jgi:16S rRNA (guanine966-N2)-methyltransferase
MLQRSSRQHINILNERFTPTTLDFNRMRHKRAENRQTGEKIVESQLRIIGGTLRRRTVHYNGDPGLRPMKDRVRESVFNLVGPDVVGSIAIDLFAGTGAMALESISRGAASAICIERRFPNAKMITESATTLGVQEQISVTPGDTFVWAKRHLPSGPTPWVVFCCPPYEFYSSRLEDMLNLIRTLVNQAPLRSVFVVESDERFSPETLPDVLTWDTRQYPPAVISIARKRNDVIPVPAATDV